MPSWLRVASLVGAIAVATSSSATDAGPAQKRQPLLALAQDARDLSVAAPDVFQRAAAFGDVHALPALKQPDSVPASSRQKRISRSAVDILVRRIGPSAGAGFMETVLAAQPPDGIGVAADDIYRIYFHGPAYQAIMATRTMAAPRPTRPASPSTPRGRLCECGCRTGNVKSGAAACRA